MQMIIKHEKHCNEFVVIDLVRNGCYIRKCKFYFIFKNECIPAISSLTLG